MMQFPSPFRKNMLDSYQETGAAWLEALPGLIQEYAERWRLRVGEPFLLSFSFVAPAWLPDGREVVLKLAVPTPDFTHQALALRAFDGHGMARMVDVDIERGAMLMERLRPGEMLADAVKDDEKATRIAAGVMRAMWIPAPAEQRFPTLADWAEDFHRIHTHFADNACPMPARTIKRAEAMLRDLLAAEGARWLLHGDLHHFNILSAQGEDGPGWLAIDPFGVAGEREVDVGAFVRNPYLTLPIDSALERLLRRRFDIFAEELGFDRQRMLAWASVYAAVSAWWTLSGGAADGWQFDVAMANLFAGWL